MELSVTSCLQNLTHSILVIFISQNVSAQLPVCGLCGFMRPPSLEHMEIRPHLLSNWGQWGQ